MCHSQRRAERDQQHELLLRAPARWRQGLEQFERRLEATDGILISRCPCCLLTGQIQVGDGLFGIFRLSEVMRELAVMIFGVRTIDRFHRDAGTLVQRLTFALQQGAVGHFLGQRVLGDVIDVGQRGLFVNEFLGLQRRQGPEQAVFVLVDDLAHQTQRKLATFMAQMPMTHSMKTLQIQ